VISAAIFVDLSVAFYSAAVASSHDSFFSAFLVASVSVLYSFNNTEIIAGYSAASAVTFSYSLILESNFICED
jgi:hypothetical protein